jgi:hypothetical protein
MISYGLGSTNTKAPEKAHAPEQGAAQPLYTDRKPAKALVSAQARSEVPAKLWLPACAGMSGDGKRRHQKAFSVFASANGVFARMKRSNSTDQFSM